MRDLRELHTDLVQVRMSPGFIAAVERMADSEETSVSELVREALRRMGVKRYMYDDLSGLEQTVEAMARAIHMNTGGAFGEAGWPCDWCMARAKDALAAALYTEQVVRASELADARAALGERWWVWKGELQEAQGRVHRAEAEVERLRASREVTDEMVARANTAYWDAGLPERGERGRTRAAEINPHRMRAALHAAFEE